MPRSSSRASTGRSSSFSICTTEAGLMDRRRRLRRKSWAKDVPIVAVSASVSPDDEWKAIEAGCTHPVSRPSYPAALTRLRPKSAAPATLRSRGALSKSACWWRLLQRRCISRGAPPPRPPRFPVDRPEKTARCPPDLVDGGVERPRIPPRGRPVAADLSHVLERGGRDLLVRCQALGAAERLDAAAHDLTLAAPPQTWASQLTSPAPRRMVRR